MATFTSKGLILPNPPTILIENLLPDPHLRLAVWNQNGATGVVTHPTTGGPNGNGYVEFDMATNNTGSPMSTELNVGTGTAGIPCVPGQTYNLSCWIFRDTPNVAESQRFTVTWYNAAGATISTDNSSNTPLAENPAIRVDRDMVAPPLAVFMKPRLAWSGTYTGGPTLRVADAQVTAGAGVKAFATRRVTADDGDTVDIGQINANLDRISLMGVGARLVQSSERPAFGSIDDMPGTVIFETDTNGIWIRRENDPTGNFIDSTYRAIAPGNWMGWGTNNPFTWLTGDNNRKIARVTMLGRLIFVHMEVRIGTGGGINAGAGILPVQLPTNRDNSVEGGFGGDAIGSTWPCGTAVANIGNQLYMGRIVLSGGQPQVRNIPNSSTAIGSSWSDTVPAVWAPGDGACFDYMYWSS